MAKIENLGFLSQAAKREEETSNKRAQMEAKQEARADKKNRSKDAVLTLDIEGKNQGFRDNQSRIGNFFKSAKEGVSSIFSKFKERWDKQGMPETTSVVPEEDTTKGRYEAVLQKIADLEAEAVSSIGSIEKPGDVLKSQQEGLNGIVAQAGGTEIPPSHSGNVIIFPGSRKAGFVETKNLGMDFTEKEQQATLKEVGLILNTKLFTERNSFPRWFEKLLDGKEMNSEEISDSISAIDDISDMEGWSDHEYVLLKRTKTILEAKKGMQVNELNEAA